jgi:hypothetical protein
MLRLTDGDHAHHKQAVEKLPALPLLIKERGVKNRLVRESRLGAPN